jgi:hypothetical protein
MRVRVIVSVVLWLFAAIVAIGGIGFVILDAMDKVESIQTRAPWITKILEWRGAIVALLMICTVLLIGNGYELLTKEMPELPAPPVVVFASPPAPKVESRAKDNPRQCTEYSLDVPADHDVAPAAEHGKTVFIFCNQKTLKPFNLSLEFDGQFINSTVPNILGNRVWPLSYNRLAPMQDSTIYKVEMNSALNAYQPMAITVYSAGALSLKRGCLGETSICR